MLTRKQLWKKCLKKSKYVAIKDDYIQGIPIVQDIKLAKDEYLPENQIFRDSGGKTLSFNHEVQVTLIPEIREYRNNNLHELLWYSDNEYKNFTRDFLEYKKTITDPKYNTI